MSVATQLLLNQASMSNTSIYRSNESIKNSNSKVNRNNYDFSKYAFGWNDPREIYKEEK
jgi:hypothetical protein